MSDNDPVILTRTEYQDLVDARDHAIAMREVATGAMETLTDAEVDAYLAAPTPLRFWRVHRGLTQADLATTVGMSQLSLTDAETGVGELAVGTLARLAQALRIRMEDLVIEEHDTVMLDAALVTTPATTTGAAVGTDDTIKVVEERLVVGKRERELGRVRVRSYVVERPVEEQVSLHEERVTLERHPVDRAVTDADRAAAFQERTIEATARAEEAAVGKDVRVVEEIGVRKEAADRVETVRDTVRRTEVEVDDQTAKVAGTTGTTTTGATLGSKAAGAGTNMSGTNSKRP